LIDSLLKIRECDLLIAIFWKRFGTQVKDAKSGTEHEFRAAYEAWKKNRTPQIMVYFSQKKYAPKSKAETDQAGLVLQFKEAFPGEGLWSDYKNIADFERQVRNHLTTLLSQQFPINKSISVTQPSPAPVMLTPLFQLPPPPADFTGRTAELAELRAAIEKGGVHISGLQGQGGVGKTALALKLAAELAPNYPDAQIHLDLKSVSEKPLTAAEAMSHVLRTFHPEAKLPEKEEELRPLYLSVLHGKRVLLLMDNAKDAAQVQPLVPPPNCVLLVTSRYHFIVDGLHARNLDTLPTDDATKLLLRIAPRIDGEADPIAKLCGYLALALRLAATAIAERIDLVPSDYRQKLADEKHRLKLLGGDKGVEASVTLSYNLLDAETKKHWRMLGVFPDTFDAAAAAAVWEGGADAAQDTLSRLLQLSMLEWNDTTKRYRLHDLMRDFARQRLTRAESDIASLRHARLYLRVLSRVDDFYRKGGNSMVSGLALFDIEWGNIQAGQAWAETNSPQGRAAAKLCSGYPDSGTYILHMRQHPREQIRWNEAALAAARQLKDRAAEGRHFGNLGDANYSLGRYRRAIRCHAEHLVIAREVCDRWGEGVSLNGLGIAHYSLGDYPRAIEYYEQALEIARKLPDHRGEGNALGNLGTTFADSGEYDRAIGYHEQRLAIARAMGDRQAEGQALGNLGIAHRSLGKHKRAIGYHEKALRISREIGDRWGEGRELGNLGYAYAELGRDHFAIQYYKQALAIAREIGDRRSEGNTLGNMSLTLDKLGDRKKAIEHAEASLKIREQIEDPNAEKVRKQLEEWKQH
jgi:tetratricopeptide (TPR) repeat protein